MKFRYLAPALLGAVALTLSGCAEAPNAGTPATSTAPTTTASVPASTEPTGDFKACMVSDEGGFDDKSFNQTSYEGVLKAEKELGVTKAQVQSANAADYTRNVQSMVDADCDIVIGVGFALTDAVVASAKANPDVFYALVDAAPAEPIDNLKGLVFNTNESSFLAGYLAAATSKSGTVATFGGAKYPSVTIFMDGYAQGIKHYNEVKGADVKLIGWDIDKQDGQFVQSTSPFTDVNAGRTTAQNQISQGADVLFPVAGNSGTGALQAAQASGGNVSAIWVDTDGCVSAESYCDVLQTSVYKAMDLAVFEAIKAAKDGNFSSEAYIGDLSNDGTGISPFHQFDSKIDAAVKSEIDALKADIISGKITVDSPSVNK